jgi:hypothetical protein
MSHAKGFAGQIPEPIRRRWSDCCIAASSGLALDE